MTKTILTPDQIYGDLFYAVQSTHIFADSKTFVDAIPKKSPAEIADDFLLQKKKASFDLLAFVSANFDFPKDNRDNLHADKTRSVRQHIDLMWGQITRSQDVDQAYSSLIALPHPYIVPGGRFREIYYWDSYFTMLGLAHSGRIDMVENMVANFAYLINRIGFIPNGNRSYYCSRSQAPFFSLMVELLAEEKQDDAIYQQYLPQLQKEYDFWMRGSNKLSEQNNVTQRVVKVGDTLLNRYWDSSTLPRPESYEEDITLASGATRDKGEVYRDLRAAAESGWDFSSRWFEDAKDMTTIRTTQILPVDLNSIMYKLEAVLSKCYQLTGEREREAFFEGRAARRKDAIQNFFFDPAAGAFVDLLLPNLEFGPTLSIATSFPLFFNLATTNQAKSVAQKLNRQFLRPGGWITTLCDSGQQWDAPNGWAPSQWVTYQGLLNYGHGEQAKSGAQCWIDNNLSVFHRTGKLLEKYNVEQLGVLAGGGEYEVQDGFGWTNAVLLKLMDEASQRA